MKKNHMYHFGCLFRGGHRIQSIIDLRGKYPDVIG